MYLNKKDLEKVLKSEDLTKDKSHAMYLLVQIIKDELSKKYNIEPEIITGNQQVSLDDNYYALGYSKNDITLTNKYTRYINNNTILRTQMSSVIPHVLRNYKKDGDKLYICPGKVYRRDVRDRTHVGEPHQLDIWYLTNNIKTREDLIGLVEVIISVIEKTKKQKIQWRYHETNHYYTDKGIEVEIYHNGNWLEILECGLIGQSLLNRHGLPEYGGLALGLGLDRLVMLIKEINDIRVLSSKDNKIKSQLENLTKYKEISKQPSIKRDLSLAVKRDVLLEEITDKIVLKYILANKIESIEVLEETSYENLLPIAVERLGINIDQKNLLLRIVLRDIEKSITNIEANKIYSEIYDLVHEGERGYLIN